MQEYYGINSSSDVLAHYGVRGMKWGIRRAIQQNNSKTLTRHYLKAQKKLQRLNAKADVHIQQQEARKHNKRAMIGLGVGLAGLAAYNANKGYAKKVLSETSNNAGASFNMPRKRKKKYSVNSEAMRIEKSGEGLGTGPVGNYITNGVHNSFLNNSKGINGYKVIGDISGAMATGGLAAAAYQKGRAIAAKYRTTEKGHAKAVAKRNSWKREMQKAFKNTRYSKLPSYYKKKN